MKRLITKIIAHVLVITLIIMSTACMGADCSDAKKKKATILINNLNSDVLVLQKGEKYKIHTKIKGGVKKGKISISSNKKKVVKIKGKTIYAKGKGQAKITLSGKQLKKKLFSVIVGTKVKKLSIKKQQYKLKVGQSKKISYRVLPKNASYKKVTWKSSNTAIASVTNKGVVLAKHTGTVQVVGKAMDGSRVKGSCVITIAKESTEGDAPTAVPTTNPTAKPTVVPTTNPTVKPTVVPTMSPTAKPTVAPTTSPTAKPTVAPTTSPTATPTVAPTTSPTATPTVAPTTSPTATPTVAPTTSPTATPIVAPSGRISVDTHFWEDLLETITFGFYEAPKQTVTITATDSKDTIQYYVDSAPTNTAKTVEELKHITFTMYTEEFALTDGSHVVYAKIIDDKDTENIAYLSSDGIQITATPTVAPTTSPTATPTEKPTTAPTATPTEEPTTAPTATPTEEPTVAPTTSPTATPTEKPTTAPTATPTEEPTTAPTATPTEEPTVAPTTSPTATPTVAPSGRISVDTHFWEDLLETITFGFYEAPKQTVTITATDSKDTIQYYVDSAPTNTAKTVEELKHITFTMYTEEFALTDGSHVVYAKIIDDKDTENIAYLSSDGIQITAAPTAAPTATPTVAPTATPTAAPTATPTEEPTATPTEEPTATPTEEPTATPTEEPTATPTEEPTATPTEEPTATPTEEPTVNPIVSPTATPAPEIVAEEEVENLVTGGSYAGVIDTPFNGIGLYGNGDYVSGTVSLTNNKIYEVIATGASNNSTQAKVSLYIGDTKYGTFYFDGTEAAESTIKFSYRGTTGNQTLKIIEEDDNGSFDVYIDKYEVVCVGDIPAAPTLPTEGAVSSGVYRNLFKESGKTDQQIDAKVNNAFEQLFYGDDDTQRIYYPVGDDMAYILDTGNSDVRSEGMSYGMMICVQLNKQTEFNRLWKWAKTYMYHDSGERRGWFAWQCSTSGSIKDNNSATDGEEYFAMSLLFAAARWGNGTGIYDYNTEAQALLKEMLHHDEMEGYYGLCNMFSDTYNLPVFVPYGSAASFTDPSYVLPAFYELWAVDGEQDQSRWKTIASTGRAFFKTTVNSTTGLAPDYANYDGSPNAQGDHGDFRFDAWRTISNIAVDYAWFGKDDWAVTQSNRLLSFFESKGIETHGNQWSLAGTCLSTDHSPGLTAMNAVGCLASTNDNVWDFVEDFWKTGVPTGKYRYYDGCLYMLGLLHVSGNFKAYVKGSVPESSATPSPTPTTDPSATATPIVSPTTTPSVSPLTTDYSLDYVTTHGTYSSSEAGNIAFTENSDNTLKIQKNSSYSSPSIYVKITLPTGHTLSEYSGIAFDFSTSASYQKLGVQINSTASTSGGYEVVEPTSNNIGGTKEISVNHTFSGMNSSISNLNEFYLVFNYYNWGNLSSLLSTVTLTRKTE